MFVKFNCGCRAIRAETPGETLQLVLKPCRPATKRTFMFYRGGSNEHLEEMPYEPLAPMEVEQLCRDVNHLMMDGDKFRQVRFLIVENGR